jgi:hypothetical protein
VISHDGPGAQVVAALAAEADLMGQRPVRGAPLLNLRPIPAWLLNPYADVGSCWGCGLEADIMIPFGCLLCRWCAELRQVHLALADVRGNR